MYVSMADYVLDIDFVGFIVVNLLYKQTMIEHLLFNLLFHIHILAFTHYSNFYLIYIPFHVKKMCK